MVPVVLMLAALELLLATDGVAELRLHVFDANQRAKPLYASAGYELVKLLEGMTELRKCLVARPVSPDAGAAAAE